MSNIIEADEQVLKVLARRTLKRAKKTTTVCPVLVIWYNVKTGLIQGFNLGVKNASYAVKASFIQMCKKYGIPKKIRISVEDAHNLNKIYWGMKNTVIETLKSGNPYKRTIEPFWFMLDSTIKQRFPVFSNQKSSIDCNKSDIKHQKQVEWEQIQSIVEHQINEWNMNISKELDLCPK